LGVEDSTFIIAVVPSAFLADSPLRRFADSILGLSAPKSEYDHEYEDEPLCPSAPLRT
jgi:hypothetical protein